MINPIIMLFSLTSFTSFNTTQLSIGYNTHETTIVHFLKHINEGHFLVNDMCESIDESYSIMSGSNKPSCDYNISYIDENNIIIYYVSDSIKNFFLEEKKNYCKKENIECGELTIMMKLINLMNSAVHISISTNNIQDLIINLDIIEFESLFKLYKSSLFNTELLANITISKQKANILLNKEKTRLYNENKKNSIFNFDYYKTIFQSTKNSVFDNSSNTTTKKPSFYKRMCDFNIFVIVLIFIILIK